MGIFSSQKNTAENQKYANKNFKRLWEEKKRGVKYKCPLSAYLLGNYSIHVTK